MKATRAEEIIKSAEIIRVQYRNNDVWLENVDKGRSTAYVTYMEKGNTVHVAVDQLEEKGLVSKL